MVPKPIFLTIYEQVADHLREEISRGRWQDSMPGLPSLADELAVNRKTVEMALRLLERQGILVAQGAGRPRRIAASNPIRQTALRVRILAFDEQFKSEPYMVDLQHRLNEAGHTAEYASKTLLELAMKARRVAQLVEQTPADAWIVCGGSREVLEWFVSQPLPAFALLGRRRSLPIPAAGPDKTVALTTALRRLIELGHRRIVMIVREEMRKPRPAVVIQKAFLDELAANGIPPTDYNLPAWEETPEGFQQLLKSLFRVTPPSALILDEGWSLVSTFQFCLANGIQVPQDLSLVCGDPEPLFDWCVPPLSHIRWNPNGLARRVVKWVENVAHGKADLRQTLTNAVFIPGGTIGPAPTVPAGRDTTH